MAEETETTSWRDGLDADLRDNPTLGRYEDIPALARGLVETKELVGRKGIILPKEGDDGDLARFRTEIGVPDTPDNYDLGDFAPPEGLPWSEDFQKGMLARLHRIGIPNGQIKQLFDDYAEESAGLYQGSLEAVIRDRDQNTAKLKTELGTGYTAALELAERALEEAAGENYEELSHMKLPDGSLLGNHPVFVRAFINVGNQFREHGVIGEKTPGERFAMTPEEALAEIAVLEKNPAYRNADDPEHKMVVEKMDTLYKRAYPEGA